ncbi:Serine/Threonine kinase domain protein (macronuclear) [Tetrahymena thermophila SB210]|uniref:Serine/Threonine kinase domain protein n=1 Tax=Tetrahymena thermophila (strain SB210) TaxID=312017 RepID=Q22UZ9_TETTS|nr:Serine/Threonine kinase domain protein [Tetrahymena thermophila SB210]EAR89149.2 Serine/Threonine kinase domain protein [Tetrahymena thermophila SB210]|eukprot:XP_001009394.2 Serine/Threonine kinase domain protein [Tetrahymena thermophila SB210]
MSTNDLKNQPFQWDLLYKLYKPQLSSEILNLNLFEDKKVNSIFANFLIAYSFERGTQVPKDTQKALQMYKYNANQLLDPLSLYRLAEIYSVKTEFNIEPNFQNSWYYLLLFSSMIQPIYDIDFFKGTSWLSRILKQADPSFTNSYSLLKELIPNDFIELSEILINLILLKLDISYESKTNQERYDDMIEQLGNILETPNKYNSNMLYCTYNILFGITFCNFPGVKERQYPKILNILSQQIELTNYKVKELQIESLFTKYQIQDNFFSQRLRNSSQQIFWITIQAKHNMLEQAKLNNNQQQINNMNQKDVLIKETDEVQQNILHSLIGNQTINLIQDIILCKRIYVYLLYTGNIKIEEALQQSYIQIELTKNDPNLSAQAEYMISKIYFKLEQFQKAFEIGQISIKKFENRIAQSQKDPETLLQCYYYKGRMEEKLYKDKTDATDSYMKGLKVFLENYESLLKINSFKHIIYQKGLIKHLLKISDSISYIDQFVQYAQQKNFKVLIPQIYYQLKSKQKSINQNNHNHQKDQNEEEVKQTQNYNQNAQEIKFFNEIYILCKSEEDIDIHSQRDNFSFDETLNDSNYKLTYQQRPSEMNIQGIISSYKSIKQYAKNEKLFITQNHVFELTKKYVLNECKMLKIEPQEIKLKSMIKKGDLGAIYGVRYNSEYYAAKVITFISQKQLKQFIDFQNKLPNCLNLLSILGYSISQNKDGAVNLYLISEIRRSNLESSMQKNELTKLEQRFKIFEQLLDCVNMLHKNNIYHSNIKDTNILLDSQCNVYLSDLAVSRVLKDYEFGENSFKEPYGAPEQMNQEEPNNGKPSDIWAVGIVCLQLFTNIQQYTPQKIKELNIYSNNDFKINSVSSSPIPEINQLENQIILFIESLLRQDPKKRLSAKDAVKKFESIKLIFNSIKKIQS